MAEHLRHELARAGVAVRPSHIDTLAGFVDEWAGIDAAPKPVLHLLIAQALEKLPLPRLAGVSTFHGFHAAVAALADELPAGAATISGKFRGELSRVRHAVQA